MFSVLKTKSLESVAGFWLHAQNRMHAVRNMNAVLSVDFMDDLFKIFDAGATFDYCSIRSK